MPDARCTRGLVCKIVRKKRTRAYRFSGGTPAFPAQWLTAYFALSPENRALLSPSSADSRFIRARSGRLAFRRLDANH